MTLVLGWHLGSFAFLATDTRITHFKTDKTGKPLVTDDVEKVFRVPVGIVALTGLHQITHALLHCVGTTEAGALANLPERLRTTHNEVKAGLDGESPSAAHAGPANGLMLATAQSEAVDIAIYHASNGYEPQAVAPNGGIQILYPTEEAIPALAPYVKALWMSARHIADASESQAYHLAQLMSFMKRASAECPTLSNLMQLGIARIDGSFDVYHLLDLADPEIPAWTL